MGAVLKFRDSVLNIRQYVCSPHPYYLPNFMDVFTWSMTFVAEKVCKIMHGVLAHSSEKGESDKKMNPKRTSEWRKRTGIMRYKVTAIARLSNVYHEIHEKGKKVLALKSLSPSVSHPLPLAAQPQEAITHALSSFDNAKDADECNERLP